MDFLYKKNVGSFNTVKSTATLDSELREIVAKLEEIKGALEENYYHDEAAIVKNHLRTIKNPLLLSKLAHDAEVHNVNPAHLFEGIVFDFADKIR